MHSFKILKKITPYLFIIITIGSTLKSEQGQYILWNETEINKLLHPNEDSSKGVYVFTNTGRIPLRINEAYSASNAIKTTIKNRIVAPGETGIIEVLFLAEKKSPGIHHNKIKVFIKGNDSSIATLHFIVTIPKLINLVPNSITWGQENINEKFTVNINLNPLFLDSLTGLEYNSSLYDLTLKTQNEATGEYLLTIEPIKQNRPFSSLIKVSARGSQINTAAEYIYLFNSSTLN